MSIHLAGLGTAFGFLFSAGLIKAAALPAVVVASRRNGGFGERLLRGTRIYLKRHGCAVCWHCIFARRPVGRWCSSTPS